MSTKHQDTKNSDNTATESSDSVKNTDSTPTDKTGNTPTFVSSKKRQTKKNRFIAIVLFLVAVIGLGVVGVLLFTRIQPRIDDTTTSTRFNSASDLVKSVDAQLKGKPVDVATANGLGGITADGYYVYALPSYATSGKKFNSKPTQGAGVGYASDAAVSSDNYKKLTTFFTNNNFNLVSSQNGDTGYISSNDNITYVSYATYESADMLCAISDADATPTKFASHIAYVGCASKDNYKKAADAYDPFFSAYIKANKNANPAELTFGDPVARNGADGYKNAVVYQNDSARLSADDSTKSFFSGYYYQAPNSSEWTFLTTGEIGGIDISCAKYTTDVLKKAFAGTTCYDDATQKKSIVQ